jgi:hypothetical protein
MFLRKFAGWKVEPLGVVAILSPLLRARRISSRCLIAWVMGIFLIRYPYLKLVPGIDFVIAYINESVLLETDGNPRDISITMTPDSSAPRMVFSSFSITNKAKTVFEVLPCRILNFARFRSLLRILTD